MGAEFHEPLTLRDFYELASMLENPTFSKALAINGGDDRSVGARAVYTDTIPLQALLIEIYENWDELMEQRRLSATGEESPSLPIPCPISFSKAETKDFRCQKKALNGYEGASTPLQGLRYDGFVPNEEYKAIAKVFRKLEKSSGDGYHM